MTNFKYSTLKIFALFILLSTVFSGCAGTGVLLKVPPYKDTIPELTTGFYAVHKIVNVVAVEKSGTEFLGDFIRRVDVETARTEQLLNKYEQTFYTALREVEDAMVAVKTYKKEYQIRKAQVKSAQSATDLSWVRYEGGMTSYLEVLDLQRSLFTSELMASETLQMQLSSIIKLYKALGGGWVPEQDTINGLGQRTTEIKKNN